MAERVEGEISTLANIVSTLKDVAINIVTYIGSLVDELRNGSARIDEIRTKIAEIDARFAMQLNDFYKDLKLLEAFYTSIYEKTEAIVEYGLSDNVIPNIIELIEQRKYPEARREIVSFFKTLAMRIKEILDQLGKEKLTKAEEVKGQVQKISSQYEKSKQQMDVLVGEERKAECFRIGTNTLLLVGMGASMFVWGNHPIGEKLELVSTHIASNPGVLSFITDRGIQGLNAITATSSEMNDLKKTIESQAQNMSMHFYKCHTNITDFEFQILRIRDIDIPNLEGNMKDVQSELQGDVDETTPTPWTKVKSHLNQMRTIFERLHADIVKKKISWESKPF